MHAGTERAGWRGRGPILVAGAVFATLIGLGASWIAELEEEPAPRLTMQYRVASVQPVTSAKEEPPRPEPDDRPASPRQAVPRAEAEGQRIELQGAVLQSAAAPGAPPPPGRGGGGGRLGLAEAAEGPGDVFGLAGKPSGRGLLGKGRLGDGSGEDRGDAGDDTDDDEEAGPGLDRGALQRRYAWYYARLATELTEAFRALEPLRHARTRIDLRVWADAQGRISRVRLVRSTGDRQLDEAILSVQGLRLREPPPSDIPMPMVARLTASRPD